MTWIIDNIYKNDLSFFLCFNYLLDYNKCIKMSAIWLSNNGRIIWCIIIIDLFQDKCLMKIKLNYTDETELN